MAALTRKELVKTFGEPIIEVTLDDEDTLNYVEEQYFVRIPMSFLVFESKKGSAAVFQSFSKDDWHGWSETGWLIMKLIKGEIK